MHTEKNYEDMPDLLQSLEPEERPFKRLQFFLFIALLSTILLNIAIAYKMLPILVKNGGLDEKGRALGACAWPLFIVPISSFILSLPASLIPFRKASYGKKYLSVSMIIMLALEVVLLFLEIFIWLLN
jgi:hypothetical protein